jgi:fluoride exporter
VLNCALVLLGGSLGATARYLLDAAIRKVLGQKTLWGIVVVNGAGSMLLGFLLGSPPRLWTLWGIGFCGALTTFSSVTVHTMQLLSTQPRRACANLSLNLVISLLAASLGLAARS